jgi:hypothetical protein
MRTLCCIKDAISLLFNCRRIVVMHNEPFKLLMSPMPFVVPPHSEMRPSMGTISRHEKLLTTEEYRRNQGIIQMDPFYHNGVVSGPRNTFLGNRFPYPPRNRIDSRRSNSNNNGHEDTQHISSNLREKPNLHQVQPCYHCPPLVLQVIDISDLTIFLMNRMHVFDSCKTHFGRNNLSNRWNYATATYLAPESHDQPDSESTSSRQIIAENSLELRIKQGGQLTAYKS